MAINKITAPSGTPASIADYQAQNALLSALLLAVQGAEQIVGGNVVKGAVFQVGGATYLATADTAITGSASDYVKLTVSVDGLSLAPSYVANLTGVTWSSTYNGYYDVDGNLYVFDEVKAFAAGSIVAKKLASMGWKNIAAGWAALLQLDADLYTTHGLDLTTGAAGTYGDVSIDSGNSWVIPAGLYMITESSNTSAARLWIYSGSAWTSYGSRPAGLVLSDGTNFKVYASGSAITITYRKIL